MKHGIFALIATLALSSAALTACDDDSKSSNDQNNSGNNNGQTNAECINGDYACQFNNLVFCSGNVWTQKEACGSKKCDAAKKLCGDNSGNTSECTDGSYECKENTLRLCDKGTWTTKESCGQKTCNAVAKACEDDENQSTNKDTDTITSETCNDSYKEHCDGEKAYFCNESKVVERDCTKTTGTCHVTTDANGNYADCVSACDLNQFSEYTTCSGSFVETHLCLATTDGGTYDYAFTDKKCAEGCSNGQCNQRTGVQEGASCSTSTCSGGDLYECTGNKFVLKKCEGNTVCTMGDAAACTPKPTVSADCDSSTFIDACVGDKLYYCHSIDNKVIELACLTTSSEVCRYVSPGQSVVSDGYAECVRPCSEGTEPLLQCIKDGDSYYTENYYCLKGSDDNWWYFPVQTSCESGCNKDAGVCL